MKRLLGICLIALAGTALVACGDDDEPTVTTPTIEAPGAPTTPTAPPGDATETAPPGEAPEAPPADGAGSSGKPPGGKDSKRGGETADLPKCAEIGPGPAPCRRRDGSVRVPERL